ERVQVDLGVLLGERLLDFRSMATQVTQVVHELSALPTCASSSASCARGASASLRAPPSAAPRRVRARWPRTTPDHSPDLRCEAGRNRSKRRSLPAPSFGRCPQGATAFPYR